MINQSRYYFKLVNLIISTVVFIFLSKALFAKEETNFKQVESTGRAVLIPGNIEVSRKRALEDALYIAALKGGADINGFSAITSNTVINDQSIVKATNRVIDFKILNEKQDKEFLSIKISAVVGGKASKQNCKIRPINITLFRGSIKTETNIPSKLSRKMPQWYNGIYDIISQLPNVNAINNRNNSLNEVIKSNINPSFDYNALTKGIPIIQGGDYSLVPELNLTEINQYSGYSNYSLEVILKIYKGQNFKLMPTKIYNLPIKYDFNSNFQFIKNVTTLNLDLVDSKVNEYLIQIAHDFLKNLNCRPLEGKLKFTEGELRIDLGSKQGLKQKQIGLVKGINIKNSMLSNSSVIVHTNKVYENYSILLPLNDNLKLNTLDNMIVEFVE